MSIPKKLHYFWDGAKELPILNQRCYASWQKHLPDYEFFHWHSKNLELKSPYYRKALKHRVWAFVSDYARLHAIYEHGGIYLDADLEVIRSFTPLLDNEFFIGFEKSSSIAVGAFGATPKHPIIKEIMDVLDQQYGQSGRLVPIPLPQIVTAILARRFEAVLEHSTNGFYDANAKVSVYPMQYFYPYNPFDPARPMDRLMISDIQPDTYAIHHWAFSWEKSFPLVALKSWAYQSSRTGALKFLVPLKRALLGQRSG